MEERTAALEQQIHDLTAGVQKLLRAQEIKRERILSGKKKEEEESSEEEDIDFEVALKKAEKGTRADHEKEILLKIRGELLVGHAKEALTLVNERLLIIGQAELFGWGATSKVEKAMELGLSEDQIRLFAAFQKAPRTGGKGSFRNKKGPKGKKKKGGEPSKKDS